MKVGRAAKGGVVVIKARSNKRVDSHLKAESGKIEAKMDTLNMIFER